MSIIIHDGIPSEMEDLSKFGVRNSSRSPQSMASAISDKQNWHAAILWDCLHR